MSVAQKPRPPSKPKAKSAKPKGTDPTAAQARAANAAAKAKAAQEKKAAKEKSDKEKAAAKVKAADEKAAKARAAEAKKAKAAADKAAKAKAAEEKKAKATADKAARAKVAEEKKAKAAADKAAKARAAEEKKANAAVDKAAKAAAKLTSPKRKTAHGKTPTPTSSEPLTLASIETQIREAYLRETRGAVKERVLLKDLRPKVGIQNEDFDQALLAMQQQGKVVLMGLDNPMERTPEVEAAAIHIAGRPRYLVYFQG